MAMDKYEITRKILCLKRHENSACVKLGIAIFVCSILCFACYFVEKSRHQSEKHASEKLVQIKRTGLPGELTQLKTELAFQPHNDFSDEGSGFYGDATEMKAGPSRIFVSNVAEFPKDVQTPDHEIPTVTSTDPIANNAGSSEFKNNIEKLFEHVPKYAEVHQFVLTDSVEQTTTKSIEASQPDSDSTEFLPDLDEIESLLSKPSGLQSESLSEERLFSSEYPIDFGSSSASLDDMSDEFLLSDYDNGDYIHLKKIEQPPKTEVPFLMESLLRGFNGLQTPIATNSHHLLNFKESPFKFDHQVLETANVKPSSVPGMVSKTQNLWQHPKQPVVGHDFFFNNWLNPQEKSLSGSMNFWNSLLDPKKL